jgi:hypothetical protein
MFPDADFPYKNSITIRPKCEGVDRKWFTPTGIKWFNRSGMPVARTFEMIFYTAGLIPRIMKDKARMTAWTSQPIMQTPTARKVLL